MSDDIDQIKEEKMDKLKQPDITVYTTPTCPYCTKLKQWMDEEGLEYTEHNVAEDRQKAQEMIQATGQQGVPQTIIGDQAVVGFQPEKIKELIEA